LDQAKSKEKEAGRPSALAPKDRQVIRKIIFFIEDIGLSCQVWLSGLPQEHSSKRYPAQQSFALVM